MPKQNPLNNNTITYRNAIYQGGIDSNKQTRKDFGILYLAKTHQFIVCNNWHNDSLEGQCLFFNDDQKFIYGTWINNIPQGFNVFRINDVLVMTEFRRGRLVKNSPLLIVFEKYNIAAILIVTNEPTGLDDLDLQIYDKKEVYTSQDVRQLFDQCQWSEDYFVNNQTLIKYISYKLSKNLSQQTQNKFVQNPCKLRLVENKYYRFGYDDGLAIIFDEDFNRISVGSHFKTKLKSFGIVFDRSQTIKKQQKGKIIKINPQNTLLKTALKNQLQKSQKNQTTQQKNISKTNLLTGINFCNKFYKNPSKLFQFYIQNIINQASIRNLIAGSLTSKNLFQESLQFSRIQSVRGNNNMTKEQLFQSGHIQRTPLKEEQYKNQQNGRLSSSRLSKQKIMQDRLRLQAIKKEIYESLQHKKSKIQKQIRNEQYQREIINKDMVGGKSHYHTPERALDKSRSRKRIFQESQKNLQLLRDFTPSRSQPNLTPFKTKMKSRIFNGEASKVSQHKIYHNPSESKSRNKSKQKTYADEDDIQIRPGVFKSFNNNRFSSGDSLDRQSQVFQRSDFPKNQRKQESIKQHQFSLNDYHVSFQDNKNLNKRSNESSSKYPSITEKNHNYVPINPSQIKQRKKSSKNFISIADQAENQQHSQSYKKIHQNQLITNDKKQFKIQKQKQNYQRQRKIPGTINYTTNQAQELDHQKNETQGLSRRRKSKNSLQVTLKQHNSKNFQQQEILHQQKYEKPSKILNQFQQKKSQQPQNRPLNQVERQTIKKAIQNEETFKQNTFDEQYESNQSKKSAFKHSNLVYLEQYEHPQRRHEKNRQNETENKKSVRKAFQYSQNKSTSSLIKDESSKSKQRQSGGISYLQKHKVKKQIQKDIQRSPDRHRCYGKSDNTPYLQNSPQYSKQFSYHNSNKKTDLSYRKQQLHYDDSSYKLMRKQKSTSFRNYPNKLF